MTATAVVERAEPNVAAHPASDTTSLLQVITRAASDASVDIDKMERLMQMHERLVARDAEQAFNAALTAVQSEMRPVAAKANNKQTKSRYATYDALDDAIRPIYTAHGFSLSFDSGDGAPADSVRVLCYLAHNGGYTRTYRVDMPADGKGAKGGDVMTKTHATGAAYSYGQRYLLGMMFNIAISGKRDDDGNGASVTLEHPKITAAQSRDLLKLIDQAGTTTDAFCEVGNIDAVPDLLAKDFDNAKYWLEERIAARKAKPTVQPNFDNVGGGDAR